MAYTDNEQPPYGRYPEDFQPERPYSPRSGNSLAAAALVLGILAVLTSWCVIGGIALGSMGIVLALLSRGREPMEMQAKVGLGLSIGGFFLSILILMLALFAFRTFSLEHSIYEDSYQPGWDSYYNYDYGYDYGYGSPYDYWP